MRRIIILLIGMWFSIATNAAVVVGNTQGQIVIDEVFDYQCPHCQQMFPIVQSLKSANAALKIRLFPVAIINSFSLTEASAALTATQYPTGFDALNTVFLTTPLHSNEEFNFTLTNLGFYTTNFTNQMHSKWVEAQIIEGLQLLKKYHCNSVPLFLVYRSNHPEKAIVLRGSQSQVELQGAINHV